MTSSRICSIPVCGKKHKALLFAHAAATSSTEECLLWPFAPTTKGYGRLQLKGKQLIAHRYVCTLVYGEALGLLACHLCGNRLCVNPRHLYWGTAKQNTADAIAHGTLIRGEAASWSKLTEEAVRSIRAETHLSSAQLAKRYGVNRSGIKKIRAGYIWRHVV